MKTIETSGKTIDDALESAQAKIQNGKLGEGLIEMQKRFNEVAKSGKKSTSEIVFVVFENV